MPRIYEMCWDGGQKRWIKMHKGRRYSVRCSILGVPATREASREAANRWWREKRLEIDAASKLAERKPRPLDDVLAALIGSKSPWTDQGSIAGGVAAYLQALPPSRAAETLAELCNDAAHDAEEGDANAWERVAAALGKQLLPQLLERMIFHGEPLPESVAAKLSPGRVIQLENASRGLRGEQAVPQERTVEAHVASWLAVQEQQVTIGEMTAARFEAVRHHARHFIDFVGPDAAVSGIDAQTLQQFYGHCVSE